jgi:hypothetical protein
MLHILALTRIIVLLTAVSGFAHSRFDLMSVQTVDEIKDCKWILMLLEYESNLFKLWTARGLEDLTLISSRKDSLN